MHRVLKEEGIGNAVLEIFSKPRVNGMAEKLGIIPGASLDLTTVQTTECHGAPTAKKRERTH